MDPPDVSNIEPQLADTQAEPVAGANATPGERAGAVLYQ